MTDWSAELASLGYFLFVENLLDISSSTIPWHPPYSTATTS
jgi:hypothetical protein